MSEWYFPYVQVTVTYELEGDRLEVLLMHERVTRF